MSDTRTLTEAPLWLSDRMTTGMHVFFAHPSEERGVILLPWAQRVRLAMTRCRQTIRLPWIFTHDLHLFVASLPGEEYQLNKSATWHAWAWVDDFPTDWSIRYPCTAVNVSFYNFLDHGEVEFVEPSGTYRSTNGAWNLALPDEPVNVLSPSMRFRFLEGLDKTADNGKPGRMAQRVAYVRLNPWP